MESLDLVRLSGDMLPIRFVYIYILSSYGGYIVFIVILVITYYSIISCDCMSN